LVACGIWGPNLLILWGVGDPQRLASGASDSGQWLVELCATVFLVGLMFFCASWFFSSFLGNPAVPVCMGLIVPFILFVAVTYAADAFHGREEEVVAAWHRWLCLALAPIFWVMGTWHYLRRVEP
jgi:hypothetical protein